jgi:hypothetical protein
MHLWESIKHEGASLLQPKLWKLIGVCDFGQPAMVDQLLMGKSEHLGKERLTCNCCPALLLWILEATAKKFGSSCWKPCLPAWYSNTLSLANRAGKGASFDWWKLSPLCL